MTANLDDAREELLTTLRTVASRKLPIAPDQIILSTDPAILDRLESVMDECDMAISMNGITGRGQPWADMSKTIFTSQMILLLTLQGDLVLEETIAELKKIRSDLQDLSLEFLEAWFAVWDLNTTGGIHTDWYRSCPA